ncbi:type 4b pilus protein PilO2 [Pseudomonas sp. HR1]|uniref:type 4b pilus protein PilO2 n=1 Tax=Pseudomonas sp. HR1 TaxID=1463361 RepID=UPI002543C0E5|nr:type 4b pilus protein PilO2 [Pseudomonas sp. HR1]MDK4199655.1 type 4b pilus protein PilO2 [Pseudomonas sp. HR1]
MAIVSTSPAAPAQTAQILSYHGKSFVSGLQWHPLGSLTGYMKEAREYGRLHKMDIVAIRRTPNVIQAGFVARSAGAMKGMYSLAAALAGQLGQSWLAAWQVPGDEPRYALVAVIDGAVIPGYDLVGSATEIQRKVAQLESRALTFDETYLPTEFGQGGKPLDIEELLQPGNLKRDYALKPLAFGMSKGEWIRVGVLGLIVVAGVIGYSQWEAHKREQKRLAAVAAEAARQAELQAINERSKEQQTIQALEHPWAKRPGVADFLLTCNGAIDRLPLSIAGWLFTSAQCDGVLLSTNYKRDGNSTASAFVAATRGHFADEPAFFDEGNGAALKLTFEPPLAGDDELLQATPALAGLTSWLHGQGLAPTVKEVPVVIPAPQAMPGQPAPPAPPPPDFKHFELTFNTALPPDIVLKDVPDQGLRLREIKTLLQSDQLAWSVTGDLYVK